MEETVATQERGSFGRLKMGREGKSKQNRDALPTAIFFTDCSVLSVRTLRWYSTPLKTEARDRKDSH